MCGHPGPFLGLGQAQPRRDHEPSSHGTQARPRHLAPYLNPCQLANPDAEFGLGKTQRGTRNRDIDEVQRRMTDVGGNAVWTAYSR